MTRAQEALTQNKIEELVSAVKNEMGVEVSPATQELFKQIFVETAEKETKCQPKCSTSAAF
jgi:hypothetical protein